MEYIEFVSNLKERGVLIPLSELPKFIEATESEGYRSLYLYDDDMLEYVSNTGSIKGYNGIIYPDWIPLDIDYKENGSHWETTMKIVGILDTMDVEYDKDYEVFFSGRGFHIMLPNELFLFEPSVNLHNTVRNTVMALFGSMVDNIYDKTRVIRCYNTINNKTRLYKIRLSRHELESGLETIHSLATQKRPYRPINRQDIEPKLKDRIVWHIEKPKPIFNDTGNINKFHCIHSLLNREPVEGERHNILLRLASHFKREGYPKKITYSILNGWAPNYDEKDKIRVIDDVYENDYSYGCNDTILDANCSTQCLFYKHKEPEILGVQDIAKYSWRYLNTAKKGLSLEFLGVDNFKFMTNTLTTIIGRTGSGKSTFIQNVIANNPDEPVLLFSLEMSPLQIYRRHIQISEGISAYDAEMKLINNPNYGVDKYKNLYITTKAPTASEIVKVVLSMNPRPTMVIVDHLLLTRGASDEYTKLVELTRTLKELSLMGYAVVGISQVGRSAAHQEHLDTYSGKGSGSIENDSDTVIAIDGSIKDGILKIRTTKEREGNFFSVEIYPNQITLRMRS
jgi:hypothetical protein